jgi:molybdenum-dependent DNA-binding transcriptional regulator ModE
MADEDDPLLAEALAASLRESASADGGSGGGGAGMEEDTRSMIERFPALKAQVLKELYARAQLKSPVKSLKEPY